MNRIGLAVLICTATPLAAQGDERHHPCPAAVDSSSEALAVRGEPRFDAVDPAKPSYFRRVLQVELQDTVGTEGLCRILEAADAKALSAWQGRSAVHVMIRLNDEPESIEELDDRRVDVEAIGGVARASRTMMPRLYWR